MAGSFVAMAVGIVGCSNEEPTPRVPARAVSHTVVEKSLTRANTSVAKSEKSETFRSERPFRPSPVLPKEDSRAGDFPPIAPLPEVPVPGDNPITQAKVELGRLLFFDDRLSGDVGTSCASCHDPRFGWGDGNGLSRGYAGTQHWRNSQTIVNAAYLSKLFWAGESPSLEAQAHSAITGNLAGNGDTAMIEERLAQTPEYVRRFKEAFGVTRPRYTLALKAIATFERAEVISSDSPLDRYLQGEQNAMSTEAVRGMALFEGKAGCIQCHHGSLLSDEKFHNLGLPENRLFETDPLRQIALRYQHYSRGVPEEIYRRANRDLGLYYTTKRREDMGKFRTPPLRYIAHTAPYMHNGVLVSLDEVVEFYDQGGGDDPLKSSLLQPLGLSEDEKFDLVEFLDALSGKIISMNPPVLPPYETMPPPGKSKERGEDHAVVIQRGAVHVIRPPIRIKR